jgi:bacterioferritin-associated ferredoxin
MTPPALAAIDKIVCHCLRVRESQIAEAISNGSESVNGVKDVIDQTGAGGGCTACHCTIRRLLAEQRRI